MSTSSSRGLSPSISGRQLCHDVPDNGAAKSGELRHRAFGKQGHFAKQLQTGTRIKLVVQAQSQPDNIASIPLLTATFVQPIPPVAWARVPHVRRDAFLGGNMMDRLIGDCYLYPRILTVPAKTKTITATDSAVRLFEANGGILSTTRAIRLGIHSRTLYALRDEATLDWKRDSELEIYHSLRIVARITSE